MKLCYLIGAICVCLPALCDEAIIDVATSNVVKIVTGPVPDAPRKYWHVPFSEGTKPPTDPLSQRAEHAGFNINWSGGVPVSATRSWTTVPLESTEATRRQRIADMIDKGTDFDDNWASKSAAQKDAMLRQMLRVIVWLLKGELN